MTQERSARRVATAIAVLVLLLFLAVLSGSPASSAAPRTLFASQTGTGTACTQAAPCGLQTALDLAVNADTIYVAAGNYTGSGTAVITITKSITLCGGWNGAPTGAVVRNSKLYPSVINGEKQRRGINAWNGAEFTLDGFTIQDGDATNAMFAGDGGGIYVHNARPILLNNTIVGNVASRPTDPQSYSRGGGVYIDEPTGTAVILGNEFSANVASLGGYGAGGGLFLDHAPGALVANNVFHANLASSGGRGEGGGLLATECPEIEISGNVLESNQASVNNSTDQGRGGAIYIENSTAARIQRNSLVNNTASASAAGYGGALDVMRCNQLWLLDNRFEGNTAAVGPSAQSQGGAILLYDSLDVLLGGNQFWKNVTSTGWGAGGGMYVYGNVSFHLANNIVVGNQAGYGGGGLYLYCEASKRITGTLEHNTFQANNVGPGNGKVAIWVGSAGVTLDMTNNLFSDHSSALFVPAGSSAFMQATLFHLNSVADLLGEGAISNLGALVGVDPLLNETAHLMRGSPAIDAGVPSSLYIDIDYDERPWGAGWDIGADEWVPPKYAFVPLVLRRR